MTPAQMEAILRQNQMAIACLSANMIKLDQNIHTVMRALEAKPNAPVFPTSIVCVRPVVFGYTADAGGINATQAGTSLALQSFDPRAVFFAGDNVYEVPSAETVSEAWEAFRWLINTQRAFYALGNHDLDGDPLGSFTTALFASYIGGMRYYGQSFSDADLAAWFYNTGMQSSGTIVEPDLIDLGSAQHEWLKNSIRDSLMGFHILVAHHPYRSINDNTIFGPDLHPEELNIKLVLNGHSHVNEHLVWNGVHYLNLSTGSQPIRVISGKDHGYPVDDPPAVYNEEGPIGASAQEAIYLWGNTDYACVGRITARERDVLVEVVKVSDGRTVHEFIIGR